MDASRREGAEAAATAAVVSLASGHRATPAIRRSGFRAEQAFLFFVRDVRSGAILVLARVTDPPA